MILDFDIPTQEIEPRKQGGRFIKKPGGKKIEKKQQRKTYCSRMDGQSTFFT
jgi:hypothetical protein